MKTSEYSGASNFYRYRHPYLPEFFLRCSSHLGLNRGHRLLDIASGSGVVAQGFSEFVGEVIGVERSKEMFKLALDQCDGSQNVRFIHGAFEEIGDVGTFDVATLGRAIHWLQPDTTLNRLDDLLKEGSYVIVCGSGFARQNGEWLQAYGTIKARWSNRRSNPKIDGIEFFRNSNFVFQQGIEVASTEKLNIADLVNHSLSYSSVFDQVISAKERYVHELELALRPFLQNGFVNARFVTWGNIFRYS